MPRIMLACSSSSRNNLASTTRAARRGVRAVPLTAAGLPTRIANLVETLSLWQLSPLAHCERQPSQGCRCHSVMIHAPNRSCLNGGFSTRQYTCLLATGGRSRNIGSPACYIENKPPSRMVRTHGVHGTAAVRRTLIAAVKGSTTGRITAEGCAPSKPGPLQMNAINPITGTAV